MFTLQLLLIVIPGDGNRSYCPTPTYESLLRLSADCPAGFRKKIFIPSFFLWSALLHLLIVSTLSAIYRIVGAKVMLSIDAAHCQQRSYVWSDGQTTPTIEVDIAGRYTASAYNDGGVEMVSEDIILSPSQKPVLTISFAGCPEKNIHFTAAVDNASIQDIVKWYVNDTLKFQGKSFSFPGVNDMKVHATIRDPSGLCYPETIIYSNTIILDCIANTNSDQDSTLPRKALKISPNPTSHNITFSINTPAAGNYQVELWNATGQIQLRRNIWIDQGSSKHTLPLPSIRSGIYYFKISGRGTQYSQKVSVW